MEQCRKDEERATEPLLDVSSTSSVGVGRATSAQTLGNVLVSIFGTGALGLPYAFKVAGWLAASLALVAATTATSIYYCMLLQVECRKKLEEDAEDSDDALQVQTFGDVGAKAFGVAGCFLSELLILVSYVGGAVAYFVIMAENLSSGMGFFITNSSIHPSAFIFLLLLPLEIALSFVRSLSFLAPFSAFATLCNVAAMVVVIKEDVDKIVGSSLETSGSAFKGFGGIPFVLGFSVFCFNGLGMTLPLEGSMSKRRMFPLVLLQAFVGLLLLYICFGAFGYMAYGEETKDIITLNLPNNWSAVSVKLILFCYSPFLCIAMALAFPMAVHPIQEIAERKLSSSAWLQKVWCKSEAKDWLVSQVARILVVLVLALSATSAPGFARLMSLMGSIVVALLAFVLPAAFHLKLMGSSLKLWRRAISYLILLAGFAFALHGAYDAISGSSTGSS